MERDGMGQAGRYALVKGQVIVPDKIVVGQALVVEGHTIAAICDEGSLSPDIACVDVGGRFVSPVRWLPCSSATKPGHRCAGSHYQCPGTSPDVLAVGGAPRMT